MKNLLILFGILLLFLFFQVTISLIFLSMAIVPLTWIYSQLIGQSYNYTIDQSEVLYKLNVVGKWCLIIFGTMMILFYPLFF